MGVCGNWIKIYRRAEGKFHPIPGDTESISKASSLESE
jgi:hypothetical protein